MIKLSKDKINELPEVIVNYIISFTCDRRGYNIEHYKEERKKIGLE